MSPLDGLLDLGSRKISDLVLRVKVNKLLAERQKDQSDSRLHPLLKFSRLLHGTLLTDKTINESYLSIDPMFLQSVNSTEIRPRRGRHLRKPTWKVEFSPRSTRRALGSLWQLQNLIYCQYSRQLKLSRQCARLCINLTVILWAPLRVKAIYTCITCFC